MTVTNDKEHPYIAEVCDILDLAVLTDLEGTPGKNDHKVYALGTHTEKAAGLVGGPQTPWFPSIGGLERFLKRNMDRIRMVAVTHEEGDSEHVDMTDWQ